MTGGAQTTFPAYLVRGDDPVLISDGLRALLKDVAGDDAGLGVEEFSGDDYEIASVVDAAQTPPFLVDRRVVVARDVGRFGAEQLKPLIAYLADPLDTTTLVLVGGGGRLNQTLANAVKKVGHVVDAGAPSRPKDRGQWLAAKAKEVGVRLDREALAHLADHLGDDVSRAGGVLRLLEAAYGSETSIGLADLEPYVGDAGSVAPWELTDAIDRGDTQASLEALSRMLDAGDRHPLVVMATLHTHYARMLRLDGAGARDEAEAAAALGMTGSTFPAKKALAQARRLGGSNVKRAIVLLSDADLDLKGQKALPDRLVMEVLVARLSRLVATTGAGAGGATSRR